MKKILAIIVSYNFEPWLEKCLNSLLQSTIKVDILVIDNNSKDRTVKIIEEKYPRIRIIRNNQNLGFGGANNLGLKICLTENYDYAFLINQDAWIASNCIEELLKVNLNNAGIVSPTHLDGTGNKMDKGFENYIKKSIIKNEHSKQVQFINAAFWLIPLSTIKKVGFFSPIFYHYGEDLDYGNRLTFFQLNFIYTKNAIAYHDRQDRQITDNQFVKSEYVYFLTEYCNINYSFTTAFLYAVLAPLKKSILSFGKGNMKLTKEYISLTLYLLRKTSEVIKTRKENKEVLNN